MHTFFSVRNIGLRWEGVIESLGARPRDWRGSGRRQQRKLGLDEVKSRRSLHSNRFEDRHSHVIIYGVAGEYTCKMTRTEKN